MDYPKCFNSKQEYEAWCEKAVEDPELENPRLSFCVDCTNHYRDRMILEQRCAYPEHEEVREELDFGTEKLS